MLARVHEWATAVWLALLCGCGFGFLARDLLELGQPAVAVVWIAGALVPLLAGRVR